MNWVMFTALFVVIYRFTTNRSGTCWRMPALLLSERTVLKEWLFRALRCIRLVESCTKRDMHLLLTSYQKSYMPKFGEYHVVVKSVQKLILPTTKVLCLFVF